MLRMWKRSVKTVQQVNMINSQIQKFMQTKEYQTNATSTSKTNVKQIPKLSSKGFTPINSQFCDKCQFIHFPPN